MIVARRVVDRCSIQNENMYAHERIDLTIRMALRYATDPEKTARRAKQLCMVCYYRESVMAGQAACKAQCGICDEVMLFSNTNTDALCCQCAKNHELCKHCGADIELKDRRNRKVIITAPTVKEND